MKFCLHGETARIARLFFLSMVLYCLPMSQIVKSQELNGNSEITSTAPATNPLDGKTFSAGIVRGSTDENADSSPLQDTLLFSNGEFSSVVCERYNFSPSPYWIRREGDQIHFLAELSSPTDGKMVWQGTIIDGKLNGTMRWTRKRWYWTVDAEHTIQGQSVN